MKHIPIRHTLCASSQKNLFIAPHHFPICLLRWRSANNIIAYTKLLSLSDMSNMNDENNERHYLKEECNSAKKMMRKHHAYDTTKYDNMYVQSPCSTRSAVTLFLTSSRRRVVVWRTSCPVNLTIPPIPFQANIDPLRLDFDTPTPPLHHHLRL